MSSAVVTTNAAESASSGAEPTAATQSDADLSEMNEETKKLIKWVEYFIRQHGGRVIGANLGSALASSNGPMYRTIKGNLNAMMQT